MSERVSEWATDKNCATADDLSETQCTVCKRAIVTWTIGALKQKTGREGQRFQGL